MIDFHIHPNGSGREAIREFCRLRISLIGSKPEIWREVLVPSNATLGWLHAVIQVAMGWTNSHLHLFQCGERQFSDPKQNVEGPPGSSGDVDESKIYLHELVKTSGEMFIYEYDFGDSWTHRVTVEDLIRSDEAIPKKAVCIDGECACPPEDCGGLPGYADLMEALRDRKHPEHKEMQRWLGRAFDPEHFLVGDTNRFLAKLPWPKVTEAALRKVLSSMR